MRKPRDYDAELESLDQKTKALKQRKIAQLGELVIACRADVLPLDVLAGALLSAASSDVAVQEAWRKDGAAMFQRRVKRSDRGQTDSDASSPSAVESGPLSLGGGARTS